MEEIVFVAIATRATISSVRRYVNLCGSNRITYRKPVGLNSSVLLAQGSYGTGGGVTARAW